MTLTKYPNCKFCGSESVLNPKTGKVFCKEKCWLKNKPDEYGAYPPTKLEAVVTSSQPDWDRLRNEKNENIRFLNSLNNACLLLSAAIKMGEITFEGALLKLNDTAQKIYDIENGQV